MKTWNDYKAHVRSVDPEVARDIDEAENISSIVTAMVKQRNAMGLSSVNSQICAAFLSLLWQGLSP